MPQSIVEPQSPPAAVLATVADYLGWDHDRLDALCERAFQARARGASDEARALAAEFASGLRRHIGLEEELLFPEFERLAGMSPHAGPTAVMRHEHRRIEGFLATLERTIGEAGAQADEARAGLLGVLVGHNVKEEQVLYPTADRLLGDSARRALVARLRSFGA
jgi:hemerythrin-like domain-containing protein